MNERPSPGVNLGPHFLFFLCFVLAISVFKMILKHSAERFSSVVPKSKKALGWGGVVCVCGVGVEMETGGGAGKWLGENRCIE